jgi:hypothetical protein
MATENNPLRNLLNAGFAYGANWAGDKLFGSQPASNEALQYERVARGQINGSGPVNARASLLAPSTWTDFFFGSRASAASVGQDGSPGTVKAAATPGGVLLLGIVAGLAVWWLLKGRA